MLIAACLLGPALLQGQTLTCNTGDTRLAELSLTVSGKEQLVFDANARSYDVWLSDSPNAATVRALPTDPAALVYVNVYNDVERFSLMAGVPGGGEVEVPLVAGGNLIKVYVKVPGGASDDYEVDARVCKAECPTPRTWQAAELLEAYDVDNAYGPTVAWDPNGDAIAVWSQHHDAGGEIWSGRYTPGVGWAAPERVESGYARYKSQRALVVDGAGNAVAVWSQGESRHYGLWANRYTPEAGWGAEQRIDAIDSLNAKYPSVAGDPGGNAVVVWSDQEPEGYRHHMWASRYSPGKGWGAPELIESFETSDASWPHVAMDPNGNAIAVWEQIFGTQSNIYANRYTYGSGWGIAAPIENEHISNDFSPEVAMDDAGNAVVIWHRTQNYVYGDDRDIWVNRYTSALGWGTAKRIDTSEERRSSYPGVAIDPDGRALACWQQLSETLYSIWCSWRAPNDWGAPELIETDELGNGYFAQPAFDGDGSALVVWERFDGERFDIWANRYTRAGGWETAGPIEHDDAGDARSPNLAVAPDGSAMATWSQSDGTRTNVWVNRFE